MRKTLALVVGLVLLLGGYLYAAGPSTYVPIPNYNTGNVINKLSPGASQTEDINRHLNGTTAIEPKFSEYTFATLPTTVINNQRFRCSNCSATTPCTGSGTGADVEGIAGAWSCTTGVVGGGGSSFPLAADASGNNFTITGMRPGVASGEPLIYGQNNGQLKANMATITVVSSVMAGPSSTALTIAAPATITNGNALVLIGAASGTPTFTLPSGFTAIRTDTAGTWTQVIACKTASSESGSYSLAFTGAAATGTGVILNVSGTDCSHVDSTGSAATNSSAITVTIPSFTTAGNNEFFVVAGSNFCSNNPTLGYGVVFQNAGATGRMTVGGYRQASAGASRTVTSAVPSASCGAGNILGAQVAFIPNTTTTGSPLISNMSGAVLASLTSSIGNNLDISAPPYSCQCIGSAADDYTCIQQAITDACAINPPPQVFIPIGHPSCNHSLPFTVTCNDIDIGGVRSANHVPGTHIRQSYDGPAFIVEAANLSELTFDAAASPLTGNALHITNTSGPAVTFTDYINSPPTRLDGLANLDIQGRTKWTTIDAGQQSYAYDCGSISPGANCSAWVRITNGTNVMSARIRVATTGDVTFTGPTISTGTSYYWHLSKNGSTCDFWVNGTEYGPLTCTGNVSQNWFEETNMPPQGGSNFFPEDGNSNIGGDLASNDFTWISNVARTDSGSPAAKPTTDSNTLLLCTWDTPVGKYVHGVQYCENGTHGVVTSVYLEIKHPVGTQTAGHHIHDLTLNTGSNRSDGIFAALTFQDEYDHLGWQANGNAFGINLHASFYSNIHDNYLPSPRIGIHYMGAGNISYGNIMGSGPFCYVSTSGAVASTNDVCTYNGTGVMNHFFQLATFTLLNPSMDMEEVNANFVCDVYSKNDYQASTIINPQNFQSSSNAPFFCQSGGAPTHVMGGKVSAFDGTPTSVFSVTSNPSSPIVATGLTRPSAVALSSQTGDPWVQEINNGAVSHPTNPLGTKAVSFNVSWASQDTISAVLGANSLVLTFQNPTKNSIDYLNLCQDATGSRTGTTFAAGTGISGALKWAGGAAPTLTTTANKCDRLKFSFDGTDLIGVLDIGAY